jgi:hypothetical protein
MHINTYSRLGVRGVWQAISLVQLSILFGLPAGERAMRHELEFDLHNFAMHGWRTTARIRIYFLFGAPHLCFRDKIICFAT